MYILSKDNNYEKNCVKNFEKKNKKRKKNIIKKM